MAHTRTAWWTRIGAGWLSNYNYDWVKNHSVCLGWLWNDWLLCFPAQRICMSGIHILFQWLTKLRFLWFFLSSSWQMPLLYLTASQDTFLSPALQLIVINYLRVWCHIESIQKCLKALFTTLERRTCTYLGVTNEQKTSFENRNYCCLSTEIQWLNVYYFPHSNMSTIVATFA
jgi:hypothetical protein